MQNCPNSPDLFASCESSPESQSASDHVIVNIEEESTESTDRSEDEDWLGASMNEIYRNTNPWNYYIPPLSPSRYHKVLFQLPVSVNSPPKPHYSSRGCHWNVDNVRMPFSEKNVFPVTEGKEKLLKPRWDLIQLALLKPISSSAELEQAIWSYNFHQRKYYALHDLFENVLDEPETQCFFQSLLPKIIQLALQLPELIASPLPLLKQGKSYSVSLSQLQIASLLANAFLCTFPWRKENITYPGINFYELFECQSSITGKFTAEKLKCILHYFRRVCTKAPVGAVTFERKHLSKVQLPRWDKLESKIANSKLHISSRGTIEEQGKGLLQVDFANCMVGGGVLCHGCVQEEIRFVICPELIVSRLFTEKLEPNEALLIIGAECYSKYKGYSDTFEWNGNYDDTTPYDEHGRRRTSIVAIDALFYNTRSVQFTPSKMIRELNKAYVGFYEHASIPKSLLSPVATGNWGCGAFRGNLQLKALLQIMACTATNRDIVYYTFGDKKLKHLIFNMYKYLVKHQVTVAQLWKYLCQFNDSKVSCRHFLPFIKQAHMDSLKSKTTNQKCLQGFFTKLSKNRSKKSPAVEKSNIEIENNNPGSSKQFDEMDIAEFLDSEIDEIKESEIAELRKPEVAKSCVKSSKSKTTRNCNYNKLSNENITSFFYPAEDKIEDARTGLLSSLVNTTNENIKAECSEIDTNSELISCDSAIFSSSDVDTKNFEITVETLEVREASKESVEELKSTISRQVHNTTKSTPTKPTPKKISDYFKIIQK